jgi:hypothetical protein
LEVVVSDDIVTRLKNAKTIRLSEWLEETETERTNAKADVGILVVKRRGHPSNSGPRYE